MASSNLIHNSSPSGKDIQFIFSTIQDGEPLDFEDFPTFQFDVFDGSAGGRFDQDEVKSITTIVSTTDPDLVFIDPEQQMLTVTVPWDRDPELAGGLARGIKQYNPDFTGEIYVYLTIVMPQGADQVSGRTRRDNSPQNSVPAEVYYPRAKYIRESFLKDKGLKPFSPTPGSDDPECYGIVGDWDPGCTVDPGEIMVKPIRANYFSGCPWYSGTTTPFTSTLTFQVHYRCPLGSADPKSPCTEILRTACRYAVLPYVIRAWKPLAPGINPCPPDDLTQPSFIVGGATKADACYQEPGCGNCLVGVQQFTINPLTIIDGVFRKGIPSYPWAARVKIDFATPITARNMPLGFCSQQVLCEHMCCCPRFVAEDADPCTEEFEHLKWRVPTSGGESGEVGCCHYADPEDDCCQGCEFTYPNTSPFEFCQVMYKGRRNACSSAACSIPGFDLGCDPDLYRVFWTESDIYTCGQQYNFWLRLSDIE